MSDNTGDIVSKIVEANALENAGRVEQAIALYREISELDRSGNYGNVAREALANLEQTKVTVSDVFTAQKTKTNNFWDRINLRTRTTLIMVAISTLSTIAVSTIAYGFARQSMTRQITTAQQKLPQKWQIKLPFICGNVLGIFKLCLI